MDRNLFQSLAVPLGNDDDDNMSNEGDMSDEDEWLPPQLEDTANNSDSDESSTSDDNPTYTELQPVTSVINQQSTSTSIEPSLESGDSASIILGKDKETQWYDTPFPESRTPRKNILKLPRNKTPNSLHVTEPVEAFLLYIDNNMIQSIVDFTNIEGAKERGSKWKNTDVTEIKAFIGCLLHTGALHQNGVSVELLFSQVDGNPLVRAAFSMKRFSHLLNHLRFDDKATRSTRRARDVLAPIRDLWDCFHNNLAKFFVAGECITVDEQLVPFRGRCSFIQYMPSKPDKYGLKIFWACDSATNYPLRGTPYLGKGANVRSTERNVGLAASTVTSLIHDFRGSGRNVTCDNYFTDLKLAETLAKDKLTMVGTIKRNKRFLPAEFQEKKALPLGESKFLFRQETSLVSFQSKRQKNVLLLSTMHSKPEIADNGKPNIVLKYNETKGGVDAMDQMAHAFTTKRKSKRWPMVFFYNILDLASIASRVVFKSKFPVDALSHEDNRQRFNISVARSLALEQIERRASMSSHHEPIRQNIACVLKSLRPQPDLAAQEPQAKCPRRDKAPLKQCRCSFCPAKKDRKTKSMCATCDRPICQEHAVILCQNCSST